MQPIGEDGGFATMAVPFPAGGIDLEVYSFRSGLQEANSSVGLGNDRLHLVLSCTTTAPIRSRQMMEELIQHHTLKEPK
jgi:hypothetical protein